MTRHPSLSPALRTRAARAARGLLAGLPAWASYHSLEHTRRTVRACRQIGRALGLPPPRMELLLLAAWFHDTGYTARIDGHEQRSAELAAAFLAAEGCSRRTIAAVRGCILATRMPQRPRSLLERVLCEADMISLGNSTFLEQNELLRREMEGRTGRPIDELAWLRRSLRFLRRYRFRSSYGKTVLEQGRLRNMDRVQRRIRYLEGREPPRRHQPAGERKRSSARRPIARARP